MKVIDLLNKIANNEEVPKEIIFEDYRYHKHPEGYFRSVINSNWIALTTDFNIYDILDDEVEIIEEDNKDNFNGWKMYQDGKEVCSMDCSPIENNKIDKLNIKKIYNRKYLCDDVTIDFLKADIIDISTKVNEIIDKLRKEK